MRNRLGIILLALIFFVGSVLFSNKVIQGFSVQEIRSFSPLAYESPQLSAASETKIVQALSQPYRFLAKGCQFYAFESQDGRFIIKFLKYKHLRKEPYNVLMSLPLPKALKNTCEKKIAARQERIDRLYSSVKIAYEELGEETGLLYHHFNRAPFYRKKLKLINPIGISQKIYLDEFDFILQEKGDSVKTCFKHCQNNPEELSAKIEQLINIVIAQCEKGIVNTDRAFVQNVGFSRDGKRALLIDIGQFVKDESIKNKEATRQEVQKRLGSLYAWTEKNFPHLIPYIKEKM